MKFMRALTLIYLIDLMVIFSVTLAQNWNQLSYGHQKRSGANCRFPLFNCRLINKLRPNKRKTALQSISQANPINSMDAGSYDQSSSYPSYALPIQADSYNVPSFYPNPQYQSQSNEYQNNGQNTAFGPQAPYTAQNYGQSPNTIDVHQVLDEFIRSAGLSPQGDHKSESAHSSSFAKAGTSPVLVFKKLLSFPFYVSSDPNVVDLNGKGWK